MTTYIYARVSTDKQTTDNQTHGLSNQHPNAIVYTETISGVKDKPVLKKLMDIIKPHDTLVIYSLDRLGRSVRELVETIETLANRSVTIVSTREGIIDAKSPVGKLMVNIMSAIAQLERDLISERTKTALMRVRATGKRLGPPVTVTTQDREMVKELRRQGFTFRQISQELEISLGTIHKILREED